MSDELPTTVSLDRIVDAVNVRTAGSRHDYLTRGDVEQVVRATLEELRVEVPAEPEPQAEPDDVDPPAPVPVPDPEPQPAE